MFLQALAETLHAAGAGFSYSCGRLLGHLQHFWFCFQRVLATKKLVDFSKRQSNIGGLACFHTMAATFAPPGAASEVAVQDLLWSSPHSILANAEQQGRHAGPQGQANESMAHNVTKNACVRDCNNVHVFSYTISNPLLPGIIYFFLGSTMFARAATPSLWIALRRSHMLLRPSTTAMSSCAIRWAKLFFPLPMFLLFEAALMIHSTAARRRCLCPRGTGICSATPPPAAPLWLRIRIRGATESIARVR